MNKVVIEGCAPWDGEYDLPSFAFTNRELHLIREISGVRGGELLDALVSEDAAVFVALGVIVLARHGKEVSPDDFWDAERSAISVEVGEESDRDLPTTPPQGGETSDYPASSGPPSDGDGA